MFFLQSNNGKTINQTIGNHSLPNYKIKSGDKLKIIVNSQYANQNEILNPFKGGDLEAGYTVSKEGQIDFPTLGRMNVVGFTTEILTDSIKLKLSKIFIDPYVYITVIGKAHVINGRGGYSINLNHNRYTIFEALAQQGSYEPDDNWKNVTVIRELDSIKKIETIDLTSDSIMHSEYYYLQNDDLIYIKPGKLNASLRSTSAIRGILGIFTGILAFLILLRR